MPLKDKFVVRLTADQRGQLEQLVATGTHSAATLVHARLLLKADQADGGPAWGDARIAEALDCATATIARVRKKFVTGGLEAALHRQRPTGRQYRKLDGAQEAQLIALACSPPPQGRDEWTMQLLADRLMELRVVESVSDETVRRTLKKTS